MNLALFFALFTPLLSFIFMLVAAPFLRRAQTATLACFSVFISFCLFIFLLLGYLQGYMVPHDLTLFQWIPVAGINAYFSLHLDSLSLLMALIITGIGFLIHVYSAGYMEHEKDFLRYFACLNFFIFSMLLLVLASNLLLLFVGWEGVGLASFLLIGYDYYRPKAAQAGTKAFIVNRIGDLGLLMGILLTFKTFGTGNIAEISSQVSAFSIGDPLITVIALLYFIGACGKSAQIPLHVWLADAMEGPTPVSALIHAATMVTAGVYLVVRMHVLFTASPFALQVIGTIGALTALFAALAACGQRDLKRVLAYSTVSQLGFMFLACGAQAYYAAMFHLTMHAFMKALLFLSAGNIVHGLHGITDMRQMGGLKKFFPITHGLFLIGVLALSGIPPFAAFFSKDLILEQEHLAGFDILFYIGLVASILTAFYMMRAYCMTFTGKSRLPAESLSAPITEAPPVMIYPCLILAALSVCGGFLGFAFSKLPPLINFLQEIGISPSEKEFSSRFHFSLEMGLAVGGAFASLFLAAFLYTRDYEKYPNTFSILRQAFYVDEIYDLLIVSPLRSVSSFISNVIEPNFFMESMNNATRSIQAIAEYLQQMQSGQIRSYAAWMTLGAAFLVVYMLTLGGISNG
ncbi:MAG: NADH-quinone oxidoreductase subunit L [Parachlamydiaceae bacterium]|nr:NADH-quinone oxidoreductase subunit L [Parachlamydiaceae bacterium]